MSARDDASRDGGQATESRRVRLALLDDHELLLDSVANWIESHEDDFELAVTASTWIDLVHSPEFPTDLVLMDLQLSEPISIEARVRTCRAAGAKVIVLTALDTEENRARALLAGAAAFLPKSLPIREAMNEGRRVMGLDDGRWADRPARGSQRQAPRVVPSTVVRPRLSPGEHRALELYAEGSTTVQVAAAMGVQYETAKTYLRRVREKYTKAGRPTSSRADLTRRAAEDGLLG
jgi:DNA-binding NarL/FixJ family response regulator